MYLENTQTTDPVLTTDSVNNNVSDSRYGLYLIGPMNGLTVDSTRFSFGNNKAAPLQIAANDLIVKDLTLQGANDGNGIGIMLSLNSSSQTLENLTINNVTATNFGLGLGAFGTTLRGFSFEGNTFKNNTSFNFYSNTDMGDLVLGGNER